MENVSKTQFDALPMMSCQMLRGQNGKFITIFRHQLYNVYLNETKLEGKCCW